MCHIVLVVVHRCAGMLKSAEYKQCVQNCSNVHRNVLNLYVEKQNFMLHFVFLMNCIQL